MILSDAQARQTIDTVLALASADQVRVNLGGGRRANTRFALNSVTTCGDTADLTVAVTACYGRRHATATTRQTDRESLQAVVERAEALARVAPEDSEHMPELGPQDYLDTDPWRESTAAATPTRRAEAALEAVQAAEAHDLTS
ncbi:MAG: PmbA/TldA family metallopeptidase, partial [Planctomycetota bacterium]